MKSSIDPLYIIFEQNLIHYQTERPEKDAFIRQVIQEYLTFLRQRNLAVPKGLEQLIVEELYSQVHLMLTKKIYGCLNIRDFQGQVTWGEKRQIRSRYLKLTRTPKKPRRGVVAG